MRFADIGSNPDTAQWFLQSSRIFDKRRNCLGGVGQVSALKKRKTPIPKF